MGEKYNGMQAIIKDANPLAVFVGYHAPDILST